LRIILEQFNVWSAIDIAIIAFVIYHALLLIRGTRAAQILSGILIIVGAFVFSSVVPLTTLNWMMNKFYSSFIIILIIIFQDDIRHMLSRMGKKSFMSSSESISSSQIIEDISRAALSMASKRIGGLIVIERNIILSRYVDIGVLIEGRVSKELLVSIFHPSSPIHDGAVIIQRGRISAAACFLPLTRDQNLDPNLGTRHRAAIGVSQETDAVVVLISEEWGRVSVVMDGVIHAVPDQKKLRDLLFDIFIDDTSTNASDLNLGSSGKGFGIAHVMQRIRSSVRSR